jgi:hypothetical protein
LVLYNLSNWHHHFSLKTMLSWIILMKYVTDELHNFNSSLIFFVDGYPMYHIWDDNNVVK